MKIRSALIIAGGMAAGVLLIAVSIHTPASFRTSATPVQKIVYDVPAIPDRTLVERSVSHYRMVGEDAVLAAYAAKASYDQAQAALNAQAAAAKASPSVAASSGGVPPSWQATAICEEGGRNDANYGYFGIQQWNGFGGYAKAGDAPLSVQLAWEAAHGQGPPDAPGQCHGY